VTFTESPFERDVSKQLILTGYQVSPHWKVGSRRVDLVLQWSPAGGQRYHPHEKLAEDKWTLGMIHRKRVPPGRMA
jgi:hypothetical protein